MRSVICFGFILLLAKTAFTLDCLQLIEQGNKTIFFDNIEPFNGDDLKCGTFELTMKSDELNEQNFTVYSSFPSILCGAPLNKTIISGYIPMVAKYFELVPDFETTEVDCCDGSFCNVCYVIIEIGNGCDVITATSFVAIVCNTLAWLLLA